jgi:hypothetical protein
MRAHNAVTLNYDWCGISHAERHWKSSRLPAHHLHMQTHGHSQAGRVLRIAMLLLQWQCSSTAEQVSSKVSP